MHINQTHQMSPYCFDLAGLSLDHLPRELEY